MSHDEHDELAFREEHVGDIEIDDAAADAVRGGAEEAGRVGQLPVRGPKPDYK